MNGRDIINKARQLMARMDELNKVGVDSNPICKVGVGFEGGGPVMHDTGEFGNRYEDCSDENRDSALPDSLCNERPFRRRCAAVEKRLDAVGKQILSKDLEAATYIQAGFGLSDEKRPDKDNDENLPQSLADENNCTSVTCHRDKEQYDTGMPRSGGVQ